MKPAAALLGLALLGGAPASALSIDIDEGPFHVGDPVPIEIRATGPADSMPALPVWDETWGKAEVRDIGPVRTETLADGRVVAKQRLLLTFFEPGRFELPKPGSKGQVAADQGPQAAGAKRPDHSDAPSEPTDSWLVEIESLLPQGEETPQPQPPANPVALPWGKPFMWTAGALGIASLIALVALLLRRQRSRAAVADEVLDPLSALDAALLRLGGSDDVERIFTEVSLQVRYFLSRMLQFPAAESTTSEIRRELRRRDLPAGLLQRTEHLLRDCDGIKFARRPASTEDAARTIEEARWIGTSTSSAVAQDEATPEAAT